MVFRGQCSSSFALASACVVAVRAVAAVTDVIVSQASTAGVQALFISKPSVYVLRSVDEYRDVGTAEGLIPVATTPLQLADAIVDVTAAGGFDKTRLARAGIPLAAVPLMHRHLDEVWSAVVPTGTSTPA